VNNLLNTWNNLSGKTRLAVFAGLCLFTPVWGLVWEVAGLAFGFVNWGAAFLFLFVWVAYKAVKFGTGAVRDHLGGLLEDETPDDEWYEAWR
jgi:hypothetical protein